ncbi:MAG: hydroxyacid dehydrogenase [Candidatus Levybacteria bacterium RIFCSPHIGHO2_02_FULL_37_13]|nr:MAG: hydroxyacid dehydrogenase [Candidatus Levybacteria bacterium RIFCSPHIGHO2_02_FULL_37_13]OGH39778.1 MAG: hydroxyacid dehydrogenase [Candidatus Levybacteria bacterium RIFCSPLOWO2_01_FULL_37_26]
MDTIVFFEIEEWEKDFIQKSYPDKKVLFTVNKAHEKNPSDLFNASVISTFIYSTLDEATLSKFPNLKLIATRSTGFDHIDLNFCKQKGIVVANVPNYGAHTVAQHTFALILAISRKLIPTIEQTRRGHFSLEGLRGFDLAGKTIGVVGAGNIGRKVINIALSFEMKVLVNTKNPPSDNVQENVRYVSFDELISSSDIVTLHVPHTKETHHLINMENVKKFKKGSILINTARGPLIETQAILEGLETGILKSAGLDVLEEECSLKEERELLTEEFLKKCDIKAQLLNHVLLDRDDVIYTSHNAFNSDEALMQILHVTVNNISSFFQGKTENLVTNGS